jgi:ubiquinone/menaquinone biosynthesis C-methylase UbiE
MLARIFLVLCSLPGLKKKLWRAWYDYLARTHRESDWTFMNYGYAGSDNAHRSLMKADEPNRHWIQLYDHVAGAVDLKGATVLEVGSGRGGGASFVKRYLGPGRMIGIDLAKNAVEFCRATHKVPGLEFKVGDAEHLPFSDASFHAVVNVESSHCYPAFEKFVSEVRRVLRPGGHFLYADFRDQTNVEGWRATLRNSQLELLSETNITPSIVVALDRDDERKLALIHRLIPKFLQPPFLDFAGVRGSAVYNAFRSGDLVYFSFVLRKPIG